MDVTEKIESMEKESHNPAEFMYLLLADAEERAKVRDKGVFKEIDLLYFMSLSVVKFFADVLAEDNFEPYDIFMMGSVAGAQYLEWARENDALDMKDTGHLKAAIMDLSAAMNPENMEDRVVAAGVTMRVYQLVEKLFDQSQGPKGKRVFPEALTGSS